MMFFSVAALLALSTTYSASSHEFSVCKNTQDLLGVSAVDFFPDPPQQGKDLKVSIEGVAQTDVLDGARLHMDIRVYGVIMDTEEFNFCEMVECPLKRGDAFAVSVTRPVPVGLPRVPATVQLTLVAADGAKASCLQSTVEVDTTPMLGGVHVVRAVFDKWKAMYPHIKANFDVFAGNWEHIMTHNSNPDATYSMAMNEFGSMTADEFVATRMGIRQDAASRKERAKDHRAQIRLRSEVSLADPPESLDWTEKGMVTQVKNQGSCGSCWAFSTIGSVESAFAIKTGTLTEFSEQELVSCDTVDQACNGGLMDNAFSWIESNTAGLCTEEAYPYTSGTTGARGACLKTSCDAVEGSVPSSFVDVAPNEAALLAAIATHGPVSVAIEADQAAFQFYHSGVLTGLCGAKLDHGVLLVGYGTDEATGLKFWKVKNSWGAGWGESGYIRMVRGKRWPMGGECGIASAASYPVFE